MIDWLAPLFKVKIFALLHYSLNSAKIRRIILFWKSSGNPAIWIKNNSGLATLDKKNLILYGTILSKAKIYSYIILTESISQIPRLFFCKLY